MIKMQYVRLILASQRLKEHLFGEKLSRQSIKNSSDDKLPTRGFKVLHLFEETTLAALRNQKLVFDHDMQLLFLPLIGKVHLETKWNQYTVDVGESLLISLDKKEACFVRNEYSSSDIHYLVMGFNSAEKVKGITRFSTIKNQLMTLFEPSSDKGLSRAMIGRWKGRDKDIYVASTENTFVWVVQGSFEMEDRLLQKADGIAFSGFEKVNFEALANDAMAIFLDLAA